MNLFHTIRAKLVASVALMVIAAMAIGIVGLMKLSEVNDRLEFTATTASKRMRYTTEALITALSLYRHQKNHILSLNATSMQEREQQMVALKTKNQKAKQKREKVASEEGKKLHDEAQASYSEFYRLNSK